MLHRLLLTLLIGFVPLVQAESALPDCPTDLSLRFHNCFGAATWPEGAKYVGEFKDDKRNGQGTYTSPSGAKYVGEFKDDWKHGQGTITFPDGEKWSGYYMNDKYVPNICSDMGLTKGTPEHGQCVLKIMDAVMSEED
jgi:hypothetical protein